METDFSHVVQDYAKYRNDVPTELINSLKLRGISFQGKKVVDLGSGTGIFSRILHEEGAIVVGVDPAIKLIKKAEEIDRTEGRTIEYVNAFSENTSLRNDTYDFVTVLRAWHWLDTKKTLTEIKRILKRNGTLVVMDSGFLSGQKVVDESLQLIREQMPNGKLKSPGSKTQSKQLINTFPVEWFKEWQENEFDLQDTYKFYYDITFSNEQWCGRVGSISWLSSFDNEKRADVLAKLLTHLEENYEGASHKINHACYVTILNRL